MNAIFLLVALATGASHLWQSYTEVRLKVEPTGTRYWRASGRYFAWSSGPIEMSHIAVFHTPRLGRPRLQSCGPAFAKPKPLGIYEFEKLVSQLSEPGRYDVHVMPNLSLDSPDRPVTRFVFGDKTLPPCRDESLLPKDSDESLLPKD